MAVFTSNQVNHVYVAKAVQANAGALSSAGDIAVGKTAEDELYFLYKNAMGGIIRSDLIPIKNIMWMKAVSAADASQKRKLKKYTITLPGSITDKTTYSVAIELNLHNGVESIYRKTASVIGRSGDSQAQATKRLAETLKASIERDDYVNDKIKIVYDFTTPGTVISIVEVPQTSKYKVGLFANESVDFKVFSDDAFINYHDGAAHPLEVLPATINDVTGSGSTDTAYTVGNSYDIADLEYFALGERGDKYRLIGWPNAAPSNTIITASEIGDGKGFCVLNIHFAFTDSNEGVQKSEKDITIAVPYGSTSDHELDVFNSLLSKVAEAGSWSPANFVLSGDVTRADLKSNQTQLLELVSSSATFTKDVTSTTVTVAQALELLQGDGGLTFTAKFSDGSTVNATSDVKITKVGDTAVTPSDNINASTQKTLTIAYTYAGITKTTTVGFTLT